MKYYRLLLNVQKFGKSPSECEINAVSRRMKVRLYSPSSLMNYQAKFKATMNTIENLVLLESVMSYIC